mgnify:CR=1 FL=1|jgi:hypothetical protein
MGNKIVIVTFIIIAISYLAFVYVQSKNEMLSSYDFVVEDIKVYPTKSIVVFSSNRKYQFWNFSFTEFDNIQKGDRLVKGKCERYIIIYRKDLLQNEYVFLKKFVDNSFPSYRCKNAL